MLAIMLAVVLFASCSNDSGNVIIEQPQKTLADYNGVWESVNNDTMFIAISSDGIVSYYFNKYAYGKGLASFNNGVLSAHNERTGGKDVLKLSEKNNGTLHITGNVTGLKLIDSSYIIDDHFVKTDENIVSFSGDLWRPVLWSGYLGGQGERTQWRMDVTSNNSAAFYKFSTTKGKLKEYGLYCIQRKYKNKIKFLYSHFTEEDNDKSVIFYYDGETIRNNQNMRFL